MRLLIIGGTVFLGRHLVESALRRGHQLTLFNRGQHNPDLFPQVEKIHGDRDGGLDALAGGRWEAVIDTCGYVPRVVRTSAESLADRVEHYTFISTISVYAEPLTPGADESAPVGRLVDESVEQITGETYGPLKALCEQAVEQTLPGRSLIIRPGLIVGPHDPSDRFTYWPGRVARGGEVLAPSGPERLSQIIDARDLADWTLAMVVRRATGTYNATGPAEPLTLGRLLQTCREVSGSDASFTWVSDEFLTENGVTPYTELPLWLPIQYAAWEMVSIQKALEAGLKFRPLAQTVRDTLEWERTRPADTPRRNGLPAERETAILKLWNSKLQSDSEN
jgi:2'-hydroxyisoflavone reductase